MCRGSITIIKSRPVVPEDVWIEVEEGVVQVLRWSAPPRDDDVELPRVESVYGAVSVGV